MFDGPRMISEAGVGGTGILSVEKVMTGKMPVPPMPSAIRYRICEKESWETGDGLRPGKPFGVTRAKAGPQ